MELSKAFGSNVITIATIVVATFWIEDRIGKKIEEAINPVALRVTLLENKVKVLEDKVLLYTYKIDAYETYFTKPKKPKLEDEK